MNYGNAITVCGLETALKGGRMTTNVVVKDAAALCAVMSGNNSWLMGVKNSDSVKS